ncbi:MAG: hypothetical protein BAA00_17020 [Parageobacillus thermoglucosidasius]|nr:hypothetical protein [Parageobacillus thermoglucosidasius]OUM91955.1 MAG: hypothetical protein BAA00_17020 [Parageobacillus thermoglucosidasius]RDE23750.1 hypothetical protein DV714_15570 [Parageobacillus thermoglucosidasius]
MGTMKIAKMSWFSISFFNLICRKICKIYRNKELFYGIILLFRKIREMLMMFKQFNSSNRMEKE